MRVENADRIEIPPVVCDSLPAHPLRPHGEIEARGADSVGMIELESRFVQEHLQHSRLKRDLQSAAREHQRSSWHSECPIARPRG